jgi:Na+-translocating ferredoxin:NAD+ oxidoreductase RnfC subunit
MTRNELIKKIFEAGVVGAGGAGFPTQVKAGSNVEFVLANGAECEPLIHKDFELMCNFPAEIVRGVEIMLELTSAKKAFFGIKSKNSAAVECIQKYYSGLRIETCLLGDFYPSGDEFELVYAATGRLIPPAGLPLDVGCVVNNVETFYNIHMASIGTPVTRKLVSVAGAVRNPSTFFVPIGISLKELLEFAGGTPLSDYCCFVSGVMMGRLTFDFEETVAKTTGGLIVLPSDHYLVKRTGRELQDKNRIGKSACDQCSYCTEFCPRYLLGYDVQPHKVMRSLVFTTSGKDLWNQYADLCCSCGLCSLYACPEDLYPREACDQSKAEMRKTGIKYQQQKPVKVHPIKEGRRVPLNQLMKRTDLSRYDSLTPFNALIPKPNEVKIIMKQHAGVPAKPIVKLGSSVKEGDLIADIEEGKLGARIHASIGGRITELSDDFIRIKVL